MKAAEALIAWSPGTRDQIEIGPLIGEGQWDWTEPYDCTGGAAYVERRSMEGWLAVAMVFIDFNSITVGDGLDPLIVHAEFLKIDEYRNRISPDIPGATPGGHDADAPETHPRPDRRDRRGGPRPAR